MGECEDAYFAAFTSCVLKRPIIYDLEVGLDADASTSRTAPDKRFKVLLLQRKRERKYSTTRGTVRTLDEDSSRIAQGTGFDAFDSGAQS
jgi:hypothetical protein